MAKDRPYHDEDTLRELYCRGGMGIEEIAEKYDVSPSTIWTWLDRFGIETSTWDGPEERFHDSYEVDDETGCWIWTGTRHEYGYGQIGVDYETVGAHRYSYKLHNGEIPEGAYICHTCHNPPCVNPDHLYAGDAQTNARDMVDAGNANRPFGEESPQSKLTEEKVVEMRALYADGETVDDLTDRFGVSAGTVSRAINGKGWPHVGGPVDVDTHSRMGRSGEENNHSKLTEEDVREIRRVYDDEDVTMKEVGERFGISSTNVSDIVNRKVWDHVE